MQFICVVLIFPPVSSPHLFLLGRIFLTNTHCAIMMLKPCSPDAPTMVKTPRDQSAIAKKWWEEKRNALRKEVLDKERLEEEQKDSLWQLEDKERLEVEQRNALQKLEDIERLEVEQRNALQKLEEDIERLEVEHRNALCKLEDDKERLACEVALLQAEKDQLLVEVDRASHKRAEDESILREARQQLSDVEPILREAGNFGGLKRIMDRDL